MEAAPPRDQGDIHACQILGRSAHDPALYAIEQAPLQGNRHAPQLLTSRYVHGQSRGRISHRRVVGWCQRLVLGPALRRTLKRAASALAGGDDDIAARAEAGDAVLSNVVGHGGSAGGLPEGLPSAAILLHRSQGSGAVSGDAGARQRVAFVVNHLPGDDALRRKPEFNTFQDLRVGQRHRITRTSRRARAVPLAQEADSFRRKPVCAGRNVFEDERPVVVRLGRASGGVLARPHERHPRPGNRFAGDRAQRTALDLAQFLGVNGLGCSDGSRPARPAAAHLSGYGCLPPPHRGNQKENGEEHLAHEIASPLNLKA